MINFEPPNKVICDPLVTATEPTLRLIVKDICEWYTSFGNNNKFSQLYSA